MGHGAGPNAGASSAVVGAVQTAGTMAVTGSTGIRQTAGTSPAITGVAAATQTGGASTEMPASAPSSDLRLRIAVSGSTSPLADETDILAHLRVRCLNAAHHIEVVETNYAATLWVCHGCRQKRFLSLWVVNTGGTELGSDAVSDSGADTLGATADRLCDDFGEGSLMSALQEIAKGIGLTL